MKKLNFRIGSTNHITVKAKINGFKGLFIVDTGASNTCISKEAIECFKLELADSNVNASGAGSNINTWQSYNNHFEIQGLEIYDLDLIIMDMSHINETLLKCDEMPVHGIIGADILMHFKCSINYKTGNMYFYN